MKWFSTLATTAFVGLLITLVFLGVFTVILPAISIGILFDLFSKGVIDTNAVD